MKAESAADELRAAIADADGLWLWLGEVTDAEGLTTLMQELSRSGGSVVQGVIVAADERALEWGQEQAESRSGWILSRRPPSLLSSLLSCFYSRSAN